MLMNANDWSFFLVRKFTNFKKKKFVNLYKTLKELLSIENVRKMQKIIKLQFLTSDISKSMGLDNLKKFRVIQNKF